MIKKEEKKPSAVSIQLKRESWQNEVMTMRYMTERDNRNDKNVMTENNDGMW